MSRNHFLDFLKGILIFLVVFGHVLQHGIHQWEGHWEDPLFKWIYMFHMPLFMAVAGYLSQWGIDRVSALQVIRTKFISYILPVIVWSTLYCLAVSLLIDPFSRETLDKFPSYLVTQITGDLWFLWALFGAIAVTALARLSGRYFPVVYPLSLIAVLFLPEYGHVILFKFTYPFFQIGYALARWGIPGFFTARRTLVFVAAALFAVLCYLSITPETYVYNSGMLLSGENAPNLLLRYSGELSMSLVVLYSLGFLYDRIPATVKRVIGQIGRDSIYIYIIQNYGFKMVDWICGKTHVPKPNLEAGWLIALLAAILICGACHLAGRILVRNDFLAAILFGRRNDGSFQR